MKPLCSVSLLVCLFIGPLLFGQSSEKDTSQYKKLKIKSLDADFLNSYYTQSGNNSAVTGGVGTEQLNNFTTAITVNVVVEDRKEREHTISLDMGIDAYTSASSDKIDPRTISSASSGDVRFYPTLSWSMDNRAKQYSIGGNLSFSGEYDYTSFGAGFSFSKYSKYRNREFNIDLKAYIDNWQLIYPVELRFKEHLNGSARNSFSASLSYNQIISRKLQLALLGDVVYQTGTLSTPFHRVYFEGEDLPRVEQLPDSRLKLPVGLRLNYFVSDFLIFRTFYRYYWDDWGLQGHTASLEVPLKISPFLSVSPFYRYYTQTATKYFAAFETHVAADQFYTSDYDLSAFDSQFFGVGVRYAPPKGIFTKYIKAVVLRYGHYNRSNGLNSDIISLNFKMGL